MSSPPPDYNPAASVLHGGTAPIMPVMGGGGMSPSPDYNAGESVLAVGGTAPPIVAVSGGGYDMVGGVDKVGGVDNDDDPSDVGTPDVGTPDVKAAAVQIEVYESFEKDTIELYRNQYIDKLHENFANPGENEWKKELKVLISEYRTYYDEKWGPNPKLPNGTSSIIPGKLFETIPSHVKTIVIFPSIDGNIKTFLKTSQFLYTQGFFENNSASDLKFKKHICVLIYGNLFKINNKDNISLLYLFLKMKHSNRDSLFLLRDPTEDNDVGLTFKKYEGLSDGKPLLNFLSPSYVISQTPVGLHKGIVFTKEDDIDSEEKGIDYTGYYKISPGDTGAILSAKNKAAASEALKDAIIADMAADKWKEDINNAKEKALSAEAAADVAREEWEKDSTNFSKALKAYGAAREWEISADSAVRLLEKAEEKYKSIKIDGRDEIRSLQERAAKAVVEAKAQKDNLTQPQAGGNPLCKSLIHLETENSLGTFVLEPQYLTFIRPGVRQSNPLICIDELGVQHSPFISGAFRSGEEDAQYVDSTKKVKLLIDGKAYLIRVIVDETTNDALAQHLKLKDNWEKGIFSRGEAELLNDLQLSPELMYTVFGSNWKGILAEFLDHVSNPKYMCYSNVSIIPSRVCDHTREFIQKVVEYRYKEELDKSIFKNMSKGADDQPGLWPEEFTKLSVSEYKKHKMGLPFTEGDTTKMNVLIVSVSGQSGLFQYEAKENILKKLEELRAKYKDTYEILW